MQMRRRESECAIVRERVCSKICECLREKEESIERVRLCVKKIKRVQCMSDMQRERERERERVRDKDTKK